MYAKIQAIVADALFVDEEDVTRESNLMGDLGAESIDFLDIFFRLEQEFGVTLPRGELEQSVRGELSEADFAINGLLQEKALDRLRRAMPEADPDLIRAGMMVREIPSLFTVATLERIVAAKVAEESQSLPTSRRAGAVAAASM